MPESSIALPARARLAAAIRRPRARWSVATFLIGLTATLAVYHQLWADPNGRVLGSRNHGNDPLQMMWFLKWVPWALLHGRNPVHTDTLFYPHGLALTWNTFVPTLGILAAPLTLTLGAAVSFAVLITLGPALTALTGFWWLRRHTRHPAPALFGALVIAFNPFVAGHMLGHLNLVFLPLVPLLLMLAEDLLWRTPRSPARTSLYLAVVAAAQAGISEEVLLVVGVAVTVAVAVALVQVPHPTAAALRRATRPLLVALAVFALLTAPMLVDQLLLSRHVVLHSQGFRAVPADYLHSMHQQLWSTANRHPTHLGEAEDGVYLGVPMLGLLLTGTVLSWRRSRTARVATVTGLVTVLLTFGVDGLPHVWLPWRLLQHVPMFSAVLPARFALATWLVIGWLLGQWLDRLARAQTRRVLAGVAATIVAATPVLTLAPAPRSTSPLPAPVAFFGSALERRLLRPDATVLLLPIAWPADARAMYYQQVDNFRFRELGGYALTADAHSIADTLTVVALEPAVGGHSAHGPRPSGTATKRITGSAPGTTTPAEGRALLRRVHPEAIVVVLAAPDSAGLVRLADELAGRAPTVTADGVAVWMLP